MGFDNIVGENWYQAAAIKSLGYVSAGANYDMPGDGLQTPYLLDPNANVFLADTNFPDSLVYAEKYAILKGAYVPLDRGVPSNYHDQAYLVNETNFNDIGGGIRTFERHYAKVPNSVTKRRIVSIPIGVSVTEINADTSTPSTTIKVELNDANTATGNKSFVANKRLILRSTVKFYRSLSIEEIEALDDGEEGTDPLEDIFGADISESATNTEIGDSASVTLTVEKGTLISRSDPEIFIGDINQYEELRLNGDATIFASSDGTVTIS